MAISKDIAEHYGKPLAKFFACANGYTDMLFDNGRFEEAILLNMSIGEILDSYNAYTKKNLRKHIFLWNSAKACLNLKRYDMARSFLDKLRIDLLEKGAGSFKMDMVNQLADEINSGLKKKKEIGYIS